MSSDLPKTLVDRAPSWTSQLVEVRRYGPSSDSLEAIRRAGRSVAGCLERSKRVGRDLDICWWRPGPTSVIRLLVTSDYCPIGGTVREQAQSVASELPLIVRRKQISLDPSISHVRGFGPDIEDCFEQIHGVPLAVAFTATPVDERYGISRVNEFNDESRLKERRDSPDLVEVERLRAAYRTLRGALGRGLWRVAIQVASTDLSNVELMLDLLASGLDFTEQPIALDLNDEDPTGQRVHLDWSLLPADVACALVRPPAREIPGVRVVPFTSFDYCAETQPDLAADGSVLSGVRLGNILDGAGSHAGVLEVPLSTLNRHTCVFGATGSGKTWMLAPIADQLIRMGLSIAVLEETKDEWMAILLGQLQGANIPLFKIMPGSVDNDDLPVSLNPLIPATTARDGATYIYPLATHAERLRYQLCAAFRAEPPLPQIFGRAISLSYTRKGIPAHLAGRIPVDYDELSFPTMSDLRIAAMEVVEANGYRGEVLANVMGAVDIRLGSLLDGPGGEFLERGHPLDIACLAASNVVLCLDLVYDDAAKMLLSTTFLTANSEYWWLKNWLARQNGDTRSQRLHKVIIGDEFHRVAPYAYPGAPWEASVKLLSDALAEDRGYGIGYIIADQSPTALIPGVIKNTALKLVKRLVDRDDRDVIAHSINMSEDQEVALVSLDKSMAVAHADGMDYPLRIEQVRPKPEIAEAGVKARIRRPIAKNACVACDQLCTRDIFTQSLTADAEKALTLLCEVAIISHMRGFGLAAPTARWRQLALRGVNVGSAEFRCALGKMVTAAVRRRSVVIPERYTMSELAEHVFDKLIAVCEEKDAGCRPEIRWRAGPYVWGSIRFGLINKSHLLYDSPDLPHPNTKSWAENGLVLHGENWHDQREEVENYFRDRRTIRIIAFGEAGSRGVLRPSTPRNVSPVEDAMYEVSARSGAVTEHVKSSLQLLNADMRLMTLFATAKGGGL